MNRLLLLGVVCVIARAQQPDKPVHPWWLRGRVLDGASKPIAGAGIAAAESGKLLTQAALEDPLVRTQADGTFELRLSPLAGRPQASLEVMVAAEGFAALRWTQSSAPKTPPKEPTELGDLRLPPGGTLKGRVRGPDGMPMAGARVTATDWIASLPSLSTSRTAFSAAVTGNDGVFTIPCALTEAALVRAWAEGCYLRSVGPLNQGEPLILELKKSGMITGKVTDPDGKPAPALMTLAYEADGSSEAAVPAEADGTFRLTLRYPCRYRVTASAPDYRTRGESSVQDGAATDVAVQLASQARTGTVLVRALDAASGAALKKFRAAEYWYQTDPTWLEGYLADQPGEESEPDGTLRLRGPQGQNTQAGTVRVSAEGYAPLTLTDVTPKDGEETLLEAKLKKESAVTGVVVDETTGEPIADAEVQWRLVPEGTTQRGYSQPTQRRFGRRPASAADGAFRLGGLGKGNYELWTMHRLRPDGRVVTVTLGDEEQKGEVRLTMPKGWAIRGKLVGAAVSAGSRVRLERESMNRYYGPLNEEEPVSDPNTVAQVAADGTFQFTGLAAGGYDLFLSWPAPPRTGAAFRLPIERLRLKRTDWVRDIEVQNDLPGRVRGKVVLEGARMRAGRFAVTATEMADPSNQAVRVIAYSDNHLAGRRALVAGDGTFELLLGPGDYRLQLVDLLTGVLLAKDSERLPVTSAQPATRDLKATVVSARVRLEGEANAPPWTASRLKIEAAVEPEKGQVGNVMFVSSGGGTGGPGLDLSEHPDDVEFLLPPGDAKLTVFSASNRLSRKPRGEQPASLGDLTVTAKAGEPASATLRIGARPEITEEEKDGKADADADAAKRAAPAAVPVPQPARKEK